MTAPLSRTRSRRSFRSIYRAGPIWNAKENRKLDARTITWTFIKINIYVSAHARAYVYACVCVCVCIMCTKTGILIKRVSSEMVSKPTEVFFALAVKINNVQQT